MIGRSVGERRLLFTIAAIIALTIGFVFLVRRPPASNTNTTATNNPARQTYAELYDIAWRQDQGVGNTTVTATLVSPAMITALASDTQKSERDQQIYTFTKNLPSDQIAFIVTFDSIDGFFSDSEILEAARVDESSVSSGAEWMIQTWKPLIGGQRPVNATIAVSSQAGVLIARASSPVDWATLKNLQLTFRDLGDQSLRQFTWAEPKLLTE